MTLPTDSPQLTEAVGVRGGDEGEPGILAALDTDVYRDMRWCSRCAGEQIFVEVFECDAGRVGVCLGCGEEKLIPFTRAVA
jgi:hypothetical protein